MTTNPFKTAKWDGDTSKKEAYASILKQMIELKRSASKNKSSTNAKTKESKVKRSYTPTDFPEDIRKKAAVDKRFRSKDNGKKVDKAKRSKRKKRGFSGSSSSSSSSSSESSHSSSSSSSSGDESESDSDGEKKRLKLELEKKLLKKYQSEIKELTTHSEHLVAELAKEKKKQKLLRKQLEENKKKKKKKHTENSDTGGDRSSKKKEKNRKKLKSMIAEKLDETLVDTKAPKEVLSLKQKMEQKLNAARFRFLNEQIYTMDSKEAKKIFEQDPDAFRVYHEGYRQQVKQWPLNPLDIVIQTVKRIGVMKIVEVVSRFERPEDFIKAVQYFGFKLMWKDLTHDFFYFMDFKKEHNIKDKSKLPQFKLHLQPCLYKKR
nr:unnamed protein product [Callosobruchus analis]